jgi:hypothetical protein
MTRPELTDGPFAGTKETLVGYYLLECADLDAALAAAPGCQSRVTARLRSVPSIT